MERGYKFVLKERLREHKSKPTKFVSVAEGVKNRLSKTIRHRKGCRLTGFDAGRSLSHGEPETPQLLSKLQLKQQQRKQQLEKWKQEKEQKKKEAAEKKRKPFVTGVPHTPVGYVPPPPVHTVRPSRSGRVTRSQANQTRSFAPNNATFQPNIATSSSISLTRNLRNKNKKQNCVTFEPIKQPVRKSITSRPKKTPKRSSPNIPNSESSSEERLRSPTANAADTTEMEAQTSEQATEEFNIRPFKPIEQLAVVKSSSLRPRTTPKRSFLSTATENNIPNSESSSEERLRSPTVKAADTTEMDAQTSERVTNEFNISPFEPIEQVVLVKSPTLRPKKTPRKSLPKAASAAAANNIPNSESSSEQRLACPTVKAAATNSPIEMEAQTSETATEEFNISPFEPNEQLALVKSTTLRPRKTPKRSIPKPLSTATENNIPNSESSSEERLRSPTVEVADTTVMEAQTPEKPTEEFNISPCVTLSRGKTNAMKEMKMKLREGLFQDDASDMETRHFRRQLDLEVSRLTAVCNFWDEINQQTELPEFVQEEILGAVGQARLLMSSKFKQFSGLVEKCELQDMSGGMITPADLQGFWEMVFLQVENVGMRFKKLEELRQRNWIEELPAPNVSKNIAPRRTKPGPSAKPARGPSRIREMIAAARKKQSSSEVPLSPSTSAPAEKTFEAGFFCVTSPVRAPAPCSASSTPASARRGGLLKDVLSNEARKASASKNKSASFAMLRASVNSKIDGIAPLMLTPTLPPIDLNATPARSILKTGHNVKKSIKTVLFDESENDAQKVTVEENAPQEDLQAIDSGINSMALKENDVHSTSKRRSYRRQRALEKAEIEAGSNKKVARRSISQSLKTNDEALLTALTPRALRNLRRSGTAVVFGEIDTNIPDDIDTKAPSVTESGEVQENIATPRRSTRKPTKITENTPEVDFTPRAIRRRGKK